MQIQSMSSGRVSSVSLEKARDLVKNDTDLTYILPGRQDPMIVMAASSGDPVLVALIVQFPDDRQAGTNHNDHSLTAPVPPSGWSLKHSFHCLILLDRLICDRHA